MSLTKEERQIQQETRDTVIELKTILLGKDGDKGLVGVIYDTAKGHSRLKRNFWLLVGFLGGSGVIGGSIYGLLNGG